VIKVSKTPRRVRAECAYVEGAIEEISPGELGKLALVPTYSYGTSKVSAFHVPGCVIFMAKRVRF
jgi:hypothetical protein